MNATRQKSRTAFTMIEMIVVMAMCMTLGALLVPLLLTGRDKARTVTCAANLGSVGAAFNTLLGPESGYFTNLYYNVTPVRSDIWWVGLRNAWDQPDPLLKEQLDQAFLCPSAKGYVNLVTDVKGGKPVLLSTNYAQNVEMPIISTNIARVSEPCNRVLLYDGDPAAVVGAWQHTRTWPEMTINRRHRGMANFLFLDGHVETRGNFRAEPFHGCGWGAKTSPTSTVITDGKEWSGRSDWVILADIEIHPESNNIKNQGQMVSCDIRLPAIPNVQVEASSVFLTGAAGHAFAQPLQAVPPITQSKGDGQIVCHVKFERSTLYDELAKGSYFGRAVPMRVVGEMTNGRPFDGIDENCVFDPPKTK